MEKITKQEILTREFNKHYERKVMHELQIALQKELDPDEVSARKPLRMGQNGQPISWEEISRKKHIEMLEKELEDIELVLKTIKNLE